MRAGPVFGIDQVLALLHPVAEFDARSGRQRSVYSAGRAAGGLKARYLFSRSCRKNLHRIAALKDPKVWQFFRPKFFFFLALMILAGSTLSRMAHGSYPFLCAVAALDISIGVALLSSGAVFFQERAFVGPAVIPTAGR